MIKHGIVATIVACMLAGASVPITAPKETKLVSATFESDGNLYTVSPSENVTAGIFTDDNGNVNRCVLDIDTTKETTNIESFYAMAAEVCELQYESDTVLLSDCNENLWAFNGCEDWSEGDCCVAIMSDNGTPNNIYDDKVISCRYNAWKLSK